MPDNQQHPQQPEPKAVPMPEARRRMGNKSRSGVYDALARGRLEGFKDGVRLLITVRSIDAYMAALPPAKFKPPTPRRPHRRQKR